MFVFDLDLKKKKICSQRKLEKWIKYIILDNILW
jgi:hypothetical protein